MGSTGISQAGQLVYRYQLTQKRPIEGGPGLGHTEDSIRWLELLAQDRAGVLWLLFLGFCGHTPESPVLACPQGALSMTLSLHHWQQVLLNLLARELRDSPKSVCPAGKGLV